jgi:ribonuclease BN (tRNA processing enzyme)
MKITFLGTGVTVSGRAGACLLIETDKKMIFDMGPRSILNMEKSGLDRKSIDAIFFSHPHADHYAEFLVYIFEGSFAYKREKKLSLYCPPGQKRVIDSILGFPIIEEIDHKTNVKEITNQEISLDETKVIAKEVKHDPKLVANAYRIEHNGKSVVYSGDSTRCSELIDVARGADLAIFEASHIEPHEKHMTPQEAGDVAEQAGVKKLVLTHLYPDSDESDVVSMAKEKFSGDVIKAEDLMRMRV